MTTAVIDRDVACVDCGYNLRGLAPTGRCPECGCAMRQSLREDRLGDAPASWRRRLVRGTWLLTLSVAAAPALCLAVLVMAALAAVVLRQLPVIPLAGGLAVTWVAVTGAALWMLTASQPERVEPTTDWRVRAATRLALAVWSVLTVGVAAAVMVTGQPLHGNWWLYDGILVGAGVVFALGMLTAWEHLAILAERLPSPALVRRLRRLRWDWIIALGLIAVLAGVANVVNLADGSGASRWWHLMGSRGSAITAGIAGVVALLLLVLWWRTVGVVYHLVRAMKGVGAEAQD